MEKNLDKNKPGRPAIGRGIQINTMWRPEQVKDIRAWIDRQPDPKPKEAEAVRILVMQAIAAGL